MKIEIELPKGYMNAAVTKDNFLIANTNNSANWDQLKFPLPKGNWIIYSASNKKVHYSAGTYTTISSTDNTPQMFNGYVDSLETVFENGELVKEYNFDETRNTANEN